MSRNRITRSTVNEQQYSAAEFPHSGFPQSYRRYSSFLMGRLHIGGFHFTMPGDTISGKTEAECTFRNIKTPIVSPVNAMTYTLYLPFRPVDRSFKKAMAPNKLNSMSAAWTVPQCSTRYLVDQIFRAYANVAYNADLTNNEFFDRFGQIFDDLVGADPYSYTLGDWSGSFDDSPSVIDLLYDTNGLVSLPVKSLITNGTRFAVMADNMYLRDALVDIADNITKKLGDSNNPLSGSMLLSEFLKLYLDCLLTPFVGRYSYYGEFKYKYLRPFDYYRIAYNLSHLGDESGYQEFLKKLDNTPQMEYPLRVLYAIWYERFRNVDLEPVSSNLPDWQEWGSTSIFDMSAGGNLLYLIYRIRSWEKDMFISAQIDDMSRHVYAPIFASSDGSSSGIHEERINNVDANTAPADSETIQTQVKPAVIELTYYDSLSDSDNQIKCPIPTNVNDVLSALDVSFQDVYGLDLNTLRQTQMLERYLKRNYLFGDEYQDRMLAHYNSRVSDFRINKPEILCQSLDGYSMQQQVSNVSTSAGTKVGDRTATATLNINSNTFRTFTEEFGIVVTLVCFMPRAMYDGITPQLLLAKQVDFPIPEFAANNEEFGRKCEIADTGLAPIDSDDAKNNHFMFGRYPAYHAWRGRVDEVGGIFLDEMQDCTFRRFWGMFSEDTTPKLNYFFLHCRPNLNMFENNILYDSQIYGDIINRCDVERVLPIPVEHI